MSCHGARERQSLEVVLTELPEAERYARVLLARLGRVATRPPVADILDVGAAQGLFVTACARLGQHAVGIEPWDEARLIASEVADSVNVSVDMLDGVAERLSFADESFDIVRANSVIEHVADASVAFREAYRVLRPGGVFWFLTASSLCPKQSEIRGFPAFGWYPDPIKLKIMDWAKTNRPDLIGHTERPAVHWFTPLKARRMLRDVGFTRVYDRWDLRLPSEGGFLYRFALSVVKLNSITKLLADIAVPCCAYAAIK